ALLPRGRAGDELAGGPIVATAAAQLEPGKDVGLIAHVATRLAVGLVSVRAHAAVRAGGAVDALQGTDRASGRQYDERHHSAHTMIVSHVRTPARKAPLSCPPCGHPVR